MDEMDSNNCKIIATMSNGTIKTLCDTKENISKCESLSEKISKKLESPNPSIHNSPSMRLALPPDSVKLRDCDCNYMIYQNVENPQEAAKVKYPLGSNILMEGSSYFNNHIYVPRQTTLSSITTDTTGFSSSTVCSPSFTVPVPPFSALSSLPPSSSDNSKNSINNWVLASLKVPGSGAVGEAGSSASDSS